MLIVKQTLRNLYKPLLGGHPNIGVRLINGFTVPVNDVNDVDGRVSHKEHENLISKLFGHSRQEHSSTIYF